MIGRLRGTMLLKQPPSLIIDVNGVGYELEAPMTTFYDLPDIGAEVVLQTHLVVREDAQLLYGFARVAERDLFRELLRVSGVGPRVALAVLSGLSAADFAACIAAGDVAMLTRVPGIGNKTAQRLVVEMRDKVSTSGLSPGVRGGVATAAPVSAVQDAVSALIALGYRAAEAQRATRPFEGRELSSEEIIREALRSMSVGTS